VLKCGALAAAFKYPPFPAIATYNGGSNPDSLASFNHEQCVVPHLAEAEVLAGIDGIATRIDVDFSILGVSVSKWNEVYNTDPFGTCAWFDVPCTCLNPRLFVPTFFRPDSRCQRLLASGRRDCQGEAPGDCWLALCCCDCFLCCVRSSTPASGSC
jgi:hypothetical protein